MPEVAEHTNTNYAKFHFRDQGTNEVYKFESVSGSYCMAWLDEHYITDYKLIYFVDNTGNICHIEKNYKPS